MRKFFVFSAFTLTLALCFSTSAKAATTEVSASPVALKAVVPEFLSIMTTGPASLNFGSGATGFGAGLGTTQLADAAPSWKLIYNLNHKTVTVIAVASDLTGSSNGNMIPAADLYAPVVGSTALPFSGTVGGHANAILMDTINDAVWNLGKTEAFSGPMFISVPGTQAPVPDTYVGTLTVYAQVI